MLDIDDRYMSAQTVPKNTLREEQYPILNKISCVHRRCEYIALGINTTESEQCEPFVSANTPFCTSHQIVWMRNRIP